LTALYAGGSGAVQDTTDTLNGSLSVRSYVPPPRSH